MKLMFKIPAKLSIQATEFSKQAIYDLPVYFRQLGASSLDECNDFIRGHSMVVELDKSKV
ncbi:hypothetical protein MXB_3048, partial [Myxobolus squamalis]